MKPIFIALILIIFTGCAGSVKPEVYYLSTENSVDKLMKSSGNIEALKEIALSLEELLIQDGSLESDKKEMLLRMVKQAFSEDVMLEDMSQFYRVNLTNQEIEKSLEWLDSALGQRIVKLELDSINVTEEQKKKELLLLNADEKRVKLIEDLNKLMLLDEMVTELIPAMISSIFHGINKIQPKEKQVTQEKVDRYVEAISQSILKDLKKELINDSLTTYSIISDEEIKLYGAFLSTAAGKKYVQASISAIIDAFLNSADRLGDAISNEVGDVDTRLLFSLSACLAGKTETMCLIEQESKNQLLRPAAKQSYVNSRLFRLKAPSSDWNKIVKNNSELSIVHKNTTAAIFASIDTNFKSLKSGETFADLAKKDLKGITDKLNVEPEHIPLNVWPYVNNGSVYGICFNTNRSTQECVYSAVAALPDGLVTMQGLTVLKDIEMQELIQWIGSIDILEVGSN